MTVKGPFIGAGALTALGAVSTHPAWPRRRLTVWGLGLLFLSGAGRVLVGFASEDAHLALHSLGALFGLAGANIGIVLLGAARWRTAAALSLVAGLVGLASFVLFPTPAAAGAAGAVERLAAYPTYIWLMGIGAYLLVSGRRWAPAAPTSAPGQEGSVPDTRAPLT